MSCKKIKRLLMDYMEDSLATKKREAVETHLSECEHCTAELSQLERLKEDLLSLEVPERGPEFWEAFNARLSQRLAFEALPAEERGLKLGAIVARPRFAFAAGVMTILLIALLAVTGILITQKSSRSGAPIPDIAMDATELATLDIQGVEVDFFLKNGTNGTDVALPDLSDEEMEDIEEELMVLMEEDLALASEDMVPDDIYEQTVYDLLDELSYEEIEHVYKQLERT